MGVIVAVVGSSLRLDRDDNGRVPALQRQRTKKQVRRTVVAVNPLHFHVSIQLYHSGVDPTVAITNEHVRGFGAERNVSDIAKLERVDASSFGAHGVQQLSSAGIIL